MNVIVAGTTKGAGAATSRRFVAGGARVVTARSAAPDFIPPEYFIQADLRWAAFPSDAPPTRMKWRS